MYKSNAHYKGIIDQLRNCVDGFGFTNDGHDINESIVFNESRSKELVTFSTELILIGELIL